MQVLLADDATTTITPPSQQQQQQPCDLLDRTKLQLMPSSRRCTAFVGKHALAADHWPKPRWAPTLLACVLISAGMDLTCSCYAPEYTMTARGVGIIMRQVGAQRAGSRACRSAKALNNVQCSKPALWEPGCAASAVGGTSWCTSCLAVLAQCWHQPGE
jgi:hypothetical protein